MNPECQQGKHDNCDTWAVDEFDVIVDCECNCHDEDVRGE